MTIPRRSACLSNRQRVERDVYMHRSQGDCLILCGGGKLSGRLPPSCYQTPPCFPLLHCHLHLFIVHHVPYTRAIPFSSIRAERIDAWQSCQLSRMPELQAKEETGPSSYQVVFRLAHYSATASDLFVLIVRGRDMLATMKGHLPRMVQRGR